VKRQALDTEVEIPYQEIAAYGSAELAQEQILGHLRRKAIEEAEKKHGRLAATVLPEIVIKRTSSILLGGDLLLVAARWQVDVPDSFVPEGRA
jgi:hypothetical protein